MAFHSRRGSHNRLHAALALCVVALILAPRVTAQNPDAVLVAEALRTAIDRALTSAPLGFEVLQPPAQTGVRVIDVRVDTPRAGATTITIDLSQKTLTYDPDGDVDALLDDIIRSTAPLTAAAGDTEYRFLVEGLPLDRFVSRGLEPGPGRPSETLARRVVVSAGHGWYWNAAFGDWRLQRDHYWGIVEDFVNWDIAQYTIRELSGTALQPYPVRHPDPYAAPGMSGRSAWQEGATYFIRDLGVPFDVWGIGIDDYARDINTRPFYANWVDAAVIVSIHNNGGGGTGTETWFDATNGFRAESERLADILNRHVVAAIRAHYNADWPDRGLRSCNGCKGENRLAARPAIILEIAFMDTARPDNEALQDERFKQIVARAIRDGLHEWAGLLRGT